MFYFTVVGYTIAQFYDFIYYKRPNISTSYEFNDLDEIDLREQIHFAYVMDYYEGSSPISIPFPHIMCQFSIMFLEYRTFFMNPGPMTISHVPTDKCSDFPPLLEKELSEGDKAKYKNAFCFNGQVAMNLQTMPPTMIQNPTKGIKAKGNFRTCKDDCLWYRLIIQEKPPIATTRCPKIYQPNLIFLRKLTVVSMPEAENYEYAWKYEVGENPMSFYSNLTNYVIFQYGQTIISDKARKFGFNDTEDNQTRVTEK